MSGKDLILFIDSKIEKHIEVQMSFVFEITIYKKIYSILRKEKMQECCAYKINRKPKNANLPCIKSKF